MSKQVRKNMFVSREVADWFENESKKTGISQSALMSMVLSNYIDQKKSLDMGDTLKKMMKMLEEQNTPK